MGMMADAKAKFQAGLGDAASIAGFTMVYERSKGTQLQRYTALLCRPDGSKVIVSGLFDPLASADSCASKMADAFVTNTPTNEIDIGA